MNFHMKRDRLDNGRFSVKFGLKNVNLIETKMFKCRSIFLCLNLLYGQVMGWLDADLDGWVETGLGKNHKQINLINTPRLLS